ncbi:hypothetical protein NDU88_009463 [Pleurodeles waltl]|uniref:Secreted protein n=1 Tax=Pleurodeles waltl TaxID=8319 RepID=A0AAV7NZP0_PLEWA|nr:hypothetical protein NDU88_009463 [Pleurodeles waltl]
MGQELLCQWLLRGCGALWDTSSCACGCSEAVARDGTGAFVPVAALRLWRVMGQELLYVRGCSETVTRHGTEALVPMDGQRLWCVMGHELLCQWLL